MKRGKPTPPAKPPDLTPARALLAQADALLDGWSCDGSTDCCRFDRTGREPFVTAVEWAVVREAVRQKGLPRRGAAQLAVLGDRSCRLLDERGACSIYEDRPLGCRSFYCDRATGPTRRPPRDALAELGRKLVALSEPIEPGEGPRSLARRLEELEGAPRDPRGLARARR